MQTGSRLALPGPGWRERNGRSLGAEFQLCKMKTLAVVSTSVTRIQTAEPRTSKWLRWHSFVSFATVEKRKKMQLSHCQPASSRRDVQAAGRPACCPPADESCGLRAGDEDLGVRDPSPPPGQVWPVWQATSGAWAPLPLPGRRPACGPGRAA